MDSGTDLPDSIFEAAKYIQEMKDKPHLSRLERENLNRAKLRIAYWACRTENVVASRENLSYVLGPDATEIMSAYDKYLDRDDQRRRERGADPRRDDDDGQFWGGA